MSFQSRLERFTQAVARPDRELDLDAAALLIGDWDHEVDVDLARRELDEIAELAADSAAEDTRPWARVHAISETLFGVLGFQGNHNDYYDPGNCFLSRVLQRRTGIPITLSILYMEIARRLDVSAVGIAFPGHFLVRVSQGTESQIVDPYHKGVLLGPRHLGELVHRFIGPDAELEPKHLATASKSQILLRILNNLAGIYAKGGDLFRSLEVLERIGALDPTNPRILRDLDQLRGQVDALN
jgi:regulator of sirC expression with transglutaminase-like and TPR domain